jgi:hypothetical protein
MLDELQLTCTSYNGQNLNSPAVSVIRGSTVYIKNIFPFYSVFFYALHCLMMAYRQGRNMQHFLINNSDIFMLGERKYEIHLEIQHHDGMISTKIFLCNVIVI